MRGCFVNASRCEVLEVLIGNLISVNLHKKASAERHAIFCGFTYMVLSRFFRPGAETPAESMDGAGVYC